MLAQTEMSVVFVRNEKISYGSVKADDGWKPSFVYKAVRSHKVPQKRFIGKPMLKRGKLRKRETQIW